MRLILELAPSGATEPNQQAQKEFDERGGVIGRSDECDWVLHCPQMLVSRRHCIVTFEDSRFYLYDASANGVFVNGSEEPLGQGTRVALDDGDSLRIGEFSVRARIVANGHGANTGRVPARVTGDPPTAPPEESVPSGAGTGVGVGRAPRSTPCPADLGDTRDRFTVPAVIPADWNFSEDPLGRDGPRPAWTPVSDRLNALEPAAARAVLDELGVSGGEQCDPELTPAVVGALARSLHISLGALYGIRADLDAVERTYAREPRKSVGCAGVPSLAGRHGGPADFLGRLIEADDDARDRLLEDLRAEVAYTRNAADGLATALWNTSRRLVRFCDPVRITDDALGRRARRRRERIARWLWLRLNPDALRWRVYREWFDSRGDGGRADTRRWFEKTVRRFILRQQRRASRID